MVGVEEFIIGLIPVIAKYGILISFFSAALGGEAAIIALSFLAAQGFINIWIVFIFGFIGTLVSDCFWFFLGRTQFAKIIDKRFSEKYKSIEKKIEKYARGRDFKILLITKFLYGTRIITLFYISLRKIRFSKFLIMDSISTFIWIWIMIGIGWLAGKGFNFILEVFKNLQLAISLLVIFGVGIYLIGKWINKKLTLKLKQ